MKVLVKDGIAKSEYPDYITEEIMSLEEGAVLYRVPEGTDVMRNVMPPDYNLGFYMSEEDPMVPTQEFAAFEVQERSGQIESIEPVGPMTENEIKAIAIG
jgi:hypothetical protein